MQTSVRAHNIIYWSVFKCTHAGMQRMWNDTIISAERYRLQASIDICWKDDSTENNALRLIGENRLSAVLVGNVDIWTNISVDILWECMYLAVL